MGLPRNFTDRTNVLTINELQIGKICTVVVDVKKYNFPRVRRLPNRVNCADNTGEIDCIFFNSYEGYIKKILPLNSRVTISGKVNYYKGRYQITNPTHISEDTNSIKKIHSNYSLTDGLTEKKYLSIIEYVLKNLPDLDEWLSIGVLKKFKNLSWKESVLKLHNPKNINKKGNHLNRLIFDEILSSFLINSKIRTAIKKIKKNRKKINFNYANTLINKLNFKLTSDQIKTIDEINKDLESNTKMFRLLQGDVGSGKTVVALISSLNVISCGYQVAIMAPTEILAKQHFALTKELFENNINIGLLTSKTNYAERKKIIDNISNNKINILIGTHSLFQDKIKFKKLGLIIIDEQHKFGVKQRKKLSDKGGKDCDILVMSATPIPRTMIMTIYGDMDTSIIKTKPKNRKNVITYSKLDTKINDLILNIKKLISKGDQIFWVCPLIEESSKVDHQSSIKRYEFLKKIFKNKVGLIHGSLNKEDKDKILLDFLKKKIDILVSTTVIEVGIDFPNANLIIIENANKFGLAQLHQLRGRVGRGNKQGSCILLFKDNLSKNSIQRIKILKSSNDGFFIAEEDMKMRGFGDIIGYQQSGEKYFKIADPVDHSDLFLFAEKYIKTIENQNLDKYDFLIKLYDKAEIIYSKN